MKHWENISRRVTELREERDALEGAQRDRVRLMQALYPFARAFRALPSAMQEEALKGVDLEQLAQGSVYFSDRGDSKSVPVLHVGDLVITTRNLAVAALLHEAHTKAQA